MSSVGVSQRLLQSKKEDMRIDFEGALYLIR